jgi:Gpi18-like mannosyltransferase
VTKLAQDDGFPATRYSFPAWASLALSVLIKLQAIILLPVFIAGTWRWFGWRRLVVGGVTFLLVLALFCLPLPENAPHGAYTAAVGLYNRSTLERMAVSCENQRCENQAYMLAPVYIDE